MKKITVRGWVLDNLGTYHRPGSTLTVSDKEAAGHIHSSRANQLAAVEATRTKAPKAKTSKRSKPSQRKSAAKPQAPAGRSAPVGAEPETPST